MEKITVSNDTILLRVCWRDDVIPEADVVIAPDFKRRLSRKDPAKESGLSLFIFTSESSYEEALERVANTTGSLRFLGSCTFEDLSKMGLAVYRAHARDSHVSVRCSNCDINVKPRCRPLGSGERDCMLVFPAKQIHAQLAAIAKVALSTAATYTIDQRLGFIK